MPEKARPKSTGAAAMPQMPDFTKMFADLKLPAKPELDALMGMYRRNMEVLSDANRVALEGAQAVARRHMEILQGSMAELTEAMQTMTAKDTPRAKAAKQADLLKAAYERAVANMKEIADLIQKSNGEALNLLNHRFSEAMAEIRSMMEKASG